MSHQLLGESTRESHSDSPSRLAGQRVQSSAISTYPALRLQA